MSTIQFKVANCKNCYKCIRSCPVKAITFRNDQAQIEENACVLCGKCLQVCPQNAKSVKNEIEKVKEFINKKYKVYASIAPSFAAAFNIKNVNAMFSVFKELGFTYAEETAFGAAKVTEEYEKHLLEKKMKNIITTACPSVVSIVEKYYPSLIDQLAPVVSPMIAHGKMLKELYGERIKVVFIGPCLAKKEEIKNGQFNEVIDAVITFEEFEKWMSEEAVSFDESSEINFSSPNNNTARFYPVPGGILKTLAGKKFGYKFAKFDGIENCINILEDIKNGRVKDYFLEMNSCVGSCINGTCMNISCGSFLEMQDKLTESINSANSCGNIKKEYNTKADFSRQYDDKSNIYKVPEERIITETLRKIGKFTKDKELNCGACGYSTCREKAIAVINNKADLHMCLPYMKEQAESISNVIIHSTPNAIFALTEDLRIQEANLAARKLFNLENIEINGRHIFDFLECVDIYLVSDSEKNVLNKKHHYKGYDVIVEQSIIYIKENHMIIVVMKDITKEEKQKEKLYKFRGESVEITQKVIEKQMRVVQEIASLLGETTAETKVALTKLKNSIQSEIGDNI